MARAPSASSRPRGGEPREAPPLLPTIPRPPLLPFNLAPAAPARSGEVPPGTMDDGFPRFLLADLAGATELRLHIRCPGGWTRHLRGGWGLPLTGGGASASRRAAFNAAATGEQGTPTALPSSARPTPLLHRRAHPLHSPLPCRLQMRHRRPISRASRSWRQISLDALAPRRARSPPRRSHRLHVGQADNELRGDLLVVVGEG
jgi:hypothetical protein